MNQEMHSNRTAHFTGQWLNSGPVHKSIRRRIMAILRASCMVLGMKRRNGGLGLLGFGGSSVSAAYDEIGFDPNEFRKGIAINARERWAASIALVTILAGVPLQVTQAQQVVIGTDNPGDNGTATATGGDAVSIGDGTTSNGSDATAVGSEANANGNFATAVGYQALANGTSSIAMGRTAVANGNAAAALGSTANATGASATAVGSVANANGDFASAFGREANATGLGATAIGTFAQANGGFASSLGRRANAVGENATAVGGQSLANGTSAAAFGSLANAQGNAAIAIGNSALANGGTAIAMGSGANASGAGVDGLGLIAIGEGAAAQGFGGGAIAQGRSAVANGSSAIALGSSANATGNHSIAQGFQTRASAASTVAIGLQSAALGVGSTAMGALSNAAALRTVAIGFASAASGDDAIALGANTNASAARSVALGSSSVANRAGGLAGYNPASALAADVTAIQATNSTTLGAVSVGTGAAGGNRQITNVAAGTNDADAVNVAQLRATQNAAVAAAGEYADRYRHVNGTSTGAGSNDAANSGAIGLQAIAIGERALALGDTAAAMGSSSFARGVGSLAVGSLANASADRAIAMGLNANASATDSVAIGNAALANADLSTAVGMGASAIGRQSTAVGYSADAVGDSSSAFGDDAFAVGFQSTAIGASAMAQNAGDVALGFGSITQAANPTLFATVGGVTYSGFAGTAPTSVVSVGTVGAERQITNVAAGRITSTSTDAINGSQLYAVAATASQGWTLETGQVGTGVVVTNTSEQIQPGETVTYQAGNNLILTQTGNTLAYSLNPVIVGVTSLQITGGPTLNSTGITMTPGNVINMAGNQITNLANGTSGSDAVNLSQLNTAIGSTNLNFVGNSGGIVNRTNGQTLAIQGATSTTPTGGAYSGSNIRTVSDPLTGAINIEIADNPVFTSVVTGNTTINTNGLTILGGPSITTAGINAANTVITNVAPGLLSSTSTNAVNGSQLFAVGNSTAASLGGGSTFNPTTGQVIASLTVGTNTYNNVQDALTQLNSTASAGWNLTTGQTGSGLALGTVLHNVTPSGTMQLTAGNNIILTQNAGNVTVALNPDLTGINSLSITGGPTLNSSGVNMNGGTISNLAAGVAGTDAVNVNQLNSAIGSVNLSFGGNSGANVVRTNGQTLMIQGGATTAGTYSGGNLRTVTDPATGAINLQMADSPQFGNVVVNANGSGQITGVTAGTLSSTSTDAVNGSQLYAVGSSSATGFGGGSSFNPATGQITVSLAVGGNSYTNVQDALAAVNTTASAGWNVNTGVVAGSTGVANGSGAVQVAPGATASFNAGNNLVVTQNGTNVAYGLNSNLTGISSIGIIGGPTINGNGITMSPGDLLDMGGNRITNVGPGINPTDAVNLSQLNSGMTNILNQANTYTDTKFGELAFDLRNFNKDAEGATASAMAMSQVPQAFEPGMGIVGFGVSTWQGEEAFAVGVSKASDNGRVIIKATGTYNTRKKGGAAVGVGIQF